MFLMNIKSVCRWILMTEFELFFNLVGLLVFTILLCIKLDSINYLVDDQHTHLTWFKVFSPLFFIDILQLNFCTIVFIRQLNENLKRDALLHFIVSCLLLLCRISFKIGLYLFVIKTIELNAKVFSTGDKMLTTSTDNVNMPTATNQIILPFKFSYVSTPFYFHLVVLLFRSCSLKKYQAYY